MRYAKVITPIPVEESFDYIIPKSILKEIKIGCRVFVPFRNRKLIGYVVGFSNKTKAKKLKPILRLIDNQPFLDREFLSLTKQISNYYCCTWAEAIETALPVSIRKGKAIKISNQTTTYLSPSCLQQAPSKFGVVLLHDLDGNKRYDIYFEEIEKTLNLNKSIIFLCPQVWQVLKVADLLQKRFGQKIAIIHRNLSKKEEIANWIQMKGGEIKICLGTRSAVFAPLPDLGLIILDCEEDESFKQNQKPFYHAREVAIMRAKRENIKVILGSVSPSLESYYLAKKRRYRLINLERSKKFPEVKIVNMSRDFLEKRRRDILSKFLEIRMSQYLTEKKKILIFLNRRGFAIYSHCKVCGFILKCPRCNVSLTYIFEKKKLICNYCNYSLDPPNLCPNCNSSYIRYKGFGLEKLESQLHLFFPQSKIVRLEKGYRADLSNLDILISTKEVLKEEFMKEFDLLGIVLADQSLNLVDFRASEKTFSLFYKLLLLCRESAVIQSYIPQHYTFKYLSKNDYVGFYKEELRQRRSLNFPPFRHIILIKLRGEKESSLIRKSNSFFEKLKRNIKDRDTEIFCPSPDYPSKLRGKFRYRILIKTKNPEKLSLLLKGILRDFSHYRIVITVDVDPL